MSNWPIFVTCYSVTTNFFVTKCKITCTKLFKVHNFLTVVYVTVWHCLWDSVHMWANQLISINLHLKTPKEKSGMPQASLISKCNKFNLLFLIFFFFQFLLLSILEWGQKREVIIWPLNLIDQTNIINTILVCLLKWIGVFKHDCEFHFVLISTVKMIHSNHKIGTFNIILYLTLLFNLFWFVAVNMCLSFFFSFPFLSSFLIFKNLYFYLFFNSILSSPPMEKVVAHRKINWK